MLKIAHHSLYNHPLKENHRFPMIKVTTKALMWHIL